MKKDSDPIPIPGRSENTQAIVTRPLLRFGIDQLPREKLLVRFIILKEEDKLSLKLKTKPAFMKYWTALNIELAELTIDLCLINLKQVQFESNPQWVSMLRVWSDNNRGFSIDDINWPQIIIDEMVNLVHECLKVHQELASTPVDEHWLTPQNLLFD